MKVPTAIVIAIIGLCGSFITAKITTAKETGDRFSSMDTAIALLEQSDKAQDKTIDDIKDDIDYIRKSMEKSNERAGIVIR